ncbi:hypothetical protein ACF0H5_022452 [Mactra antiquata]
MYATRNIIKTFILFVWMVQIVSAQLTCPSGDTAGIIKNGQTCSQLITADKSECYNSTIETSCCSSCNGSRTTIPGCLYGDRATCYLILCSSYTGDALTNCCFTCYTPTTSTSTSSTASTSTTSSLTTSTTTSTPSNSTGNTGASTGNSSSGSSAGVIAGAVIGSMTCVAILIGGLWFLSRWYKKKNKVNGNDLEKDKSEMVNSEKNPDDMNKEFPIKSYNGHLGGLSQPVPPIATNNQIFNTNNNNTSKSEEKSNDASKENDEMKTDKADDNVKDNQTDVGQSNAEQNPVSPRQSLPPLQKIKPGVTNQQNPLPPIAYRK